MLLRFEVSNHRSILHPVELLMAALDQDRAAARGFDLLSEHVLTVAGIYGANASGKSNIIEAIAWLSDAVSDSLIGWDDHVPRDPHRFGDGPLSPSTFEIDLVVEGVRHDYRLEVDDTAVLRESLHSYPERRRRTLLEREGSEVSLRRGLSGLTGIQELLTPTTLALSAAIRVGDPSIRIAGRALANIQAVRLTQRQRSAFLRRSPLSASAHLFTDEDEAEEVLLRGSANRTTALELLRIADPGIEDVEIVRGNEKSSGSLLRQMYFIRQCQENNERIALELGEESAGTRTWFRYLAPTLQTLQEGQILLFDEIDASLHPRLSARLLEMFQDPRTNPHDAQLIFTSHDATLLNALNRDEVWLTEKGLDNTTDLIALAEFGGDRVRRSVNLEKAYLQGRFGGVPEVDQIAMRKALEIAFPTD